MLSSNLSSKSNLSTECWFESNRFLEILSEDIIYKLFYEDSNKQLISKITLFYRDGEPFTIINRTIESLFYELLTGCYTNCVCKLDISEISILLEIEVALNFLRNIATKKSVYCSTFTGICGVGFDQTDKIEFDGLVLKNIAQNDFSGDISSVTLGVHGNHKRVNFYGLVAETKYLLQSKSKTLSAKNVKANIINDVRLKSDAYKKISDFYLAILIVKGDVSSLVTSFEKTGFYFENSQYTRDINCDSKLLPLYLEEIEEVKKIYSDLCICDNKSLSNAIHNLKNAILSGSSVEDAIMNAFYSWESMFTSSENTTETVVYGISTYSQSDYERVNDLYDRYRSYKAHGDTFKIKDDSSLYEIRDEVLRIATTCLKQMFGDNELMALKPSKRVKKLRERNGKQIILQ